MSERDDQDSPKPQEPKPAQQPWAGARPEAKPDPAPEATSKTKAGAGADAAAAGTGSESGSGGEAPPAGRSSRRPLILAVAAIALAAVIGVASLPFVLPYLSPAPVPPTVPALQERAQQIARLDERLARLESAGEAAAGTPAAAELVGNLRERLYAVESQLAEAADAEQRLQALEQAVAEMRQAPANGEAAAERQALEARLRALEARLQQGDRQEAATGEQQARETERLEQRLAEAERRLGEMAERLGQDGARAAEAAAASRRLAVQVAVGQLREAALSGRPFGAELAMVRDLGGGELPAEPLQRLAELEQQPEPVATLADLRRDFPAARTAALGALDASQEGPWWRRSLARLGSLVTIRRTGEIEGEAPDAVLSRVEARLGEGRLAAAMAELGQLPEPALAAMAGWRQRAERRLAAAAALGELAGGQGQAG